MWSAQVHVPPIVSNVRATQRETARPAISAASGPDDERFANLDTAINGRPAAERLVRAPNWTRSESDTAFAAITVVDIPRSSVISMVTRASSVRKLFGVMVFPPLVVTPAGVGNLRPSQQPGPEHVTRQTSDDGHDAEADECRQVAEPQRTGDQDIGPLGGSVRRVTGVSPGLLG